MRKGYGVERKAFKKRILIKNVKVFSLMLSFAALFESFRRHAGSCKLVGNSHVKEV
jgi:hypothetical protein